MHRELDAFSRVAHLAAQSGALQGRDLADILGALDEQNVGFAGLRERAGAPEPDRAAADDDDFGAGQVLHEPYGG